jgi:Trk K+ transport system NAD-binding subunit
MMILGGLGGIDTLVFVRPERLPHETNVDLPGVARRFVVCGDNPIAYRLVETLITQYDAQVTVILPSVEQSWAPKIVQVPGIDVVESSRLDTEAFERARVRDAAALALVDQEDASNVDAALIAQEMNPDLRIVIRMFNLRLGVRLTELLNNSAVLSAAAIAAPAFVAAALDEATTAPIAAGDATVVATPRAKARADDILTDIAVIDGRDEPVLLPGPDIQGDLVLARARPVTPRTPRKRKRTVNIMAVLTGKRVRLTLALLLGTFAGATAMLAVIREQGLGDAAYIAILSELGGANADANASGAERLILTVLTIVSIALIPAITAAVVDSVVKARLRIEAGLLTERISSHMVVVGLGDVGSRVITAFDAAGVEVVAIERNPDARGVQVARDLGIPVIIGDASRVEVLQAASVATCRALVVVSTDDVTNLETALLGRTEQAELKVVMRLFDGEFADRVERAFAINTTRSVSYLAAPAFAAAMLGRQVIETIPVKRHVLLIAEVPVGAGSALEHKPASTVNRDHEVRLLAVRTSATVLWRPSGGRPLKQGERLLVITTRAGLSDLTNESTPAASDEPAPYRLLEPWEIPPSRSGSGQVMTEEPSANPPLGPADTDARGPA